MLCRQVFSSCIEDTQIDIKLAQAPVGEVLANVAELVIRFREAAGASENEEDLRVRIEGILRDYLSRLGIRYEARYDTMIGRSHKPDSLYGTVIVEYKSPQLFKKKKPFDTLCKKLKVEIQKKAKQDKLDITKYVGILFDGYTFGFVKFRYGKWQTLGPLSLNNQSLLLFLEYLRGLAKWPLTAEHMARGFGPRSPVARCCIGAFTKKLAEIPREGKAALLFHEWKRVFAQVSGYELHELPEIRDMAESYGLGETDVSKIIFATHTYYALVIKLLAAELVTIHHDSLLQSYLEKLSTLAGNALKKEIEHLENEGGVFKDLGIGNFLEGDFFSWYVAIWDEEISESIRNLVSTFREYEPATAKLEPDATRDLLKRLYQYLVPKKLRHDLGEFYTPDWLAEYVLDEVGYDGNPNKRLLDPTCGSGTFLTLAISRAKEYGAHARIENKELLNKILQNIVGFDLNPLAVITARTNYLLGLGELIREAPTVFEIPIFLSDSIYGPKLTTTVYGRAYNYEITTALGKIELSIPSEIVESRKVGRLMSVIERYVVRLAPASECIARLREELSLPPEVFSRIEDSLIELYGRLSFLKEKQWDEIWCRIIKNYYAPTTVGRFHYVVGNPPWVRWTMLPKAYREAVKPYWRDYGLFSSDRWVGGVESDISTVLTYTAIDRWLMPKRPIGFLITQTVFKSESAEGFRSFKLPDGTAIGVQRVHDMVDVKPFEGANNRTSIPLAVKGVKTSYPIPYIKWTTEKRIEQDARLEDVLGRTQRKKLAAEPVYSPNGPWITADRNTLKTLRRIVGRSDYRARKGADTDLNGVFWMEILRRTDKKIEIRNLHDVGRKKVEPFIGLIDSELIFPLVRGRDIAAFCWEPSGTYILVPQETMIGFDERTLRDKGLDLTLGYLLRYRDLLVQRSSWKKYHEPIAAPFYSLFNVGPYTFQPYKVAWREIQRGFAAAVISPKEDPYLGKKTAIPDHKLFFVPSDSEDEAHYLCAVLNSDLVKTLIESYVVETQVATHVMEYVKIPRFQPHDPKHRRLAELSKKAHNVSGKLAIEEKEALERWARESLGGA
jgi:hypothetical protein